VKGEKCLPMVIDMVDLAFRNFRNQGKGLARRTIDIYHVHNQLGVSPLDIVHLCSSSGRGAELLELIVIWRIAYMLPQAILVPNF
jgi:hypothetical protein